jgi:hypothetical protein
MSTPNFFIGYDVTIVDARLVGLLPSTARPWRFIFIVPEEASFELQRLGGGTAHWQGHCAGAGKAHRYVLWLDVLERKPE